MENVPRTIVTDNRFAIVPHWVIFSGISDGALRLYTVLTKYADGHTKQAFPSRTTLAKDMGKKSVRSIDGYMRELKEIGAVTVENRKRKGSKENQTNLYIVRTVNPHVVQNTAPPSAEDCSENYTHLSTPTYYPYATDSRISDPTPASYEDAGRNITAQTGISQQTKNQLVDEAVRLYLSGNHEYDWDEWEAFAKQITEQTGYFVDDLIANRRFASRLAELIEAHADKGLRYGASAWLGVLLNHPEAA